MPLTNFSFPRRIVYLTALCLLFLFLISFISLEKRRPGWPFATSQDVSFHRPRPGDVEQSLTPSSRTELSTTPIINSDAGLLPLPTEYTVHNAELPFCAQRYGLDFLKTLRETQTEYCSASSSSSIRCFHVQTNKDGHVDSMCLARASTFSQESRRFELDCEQVEPESPDSHGRVIPGLNSLARYWYETGPAIIMNNFVSVSRGSPVATSSRHTGFSVLLKREGEGNLWHCLMEIFSLTMTFDVLRTSRDLENNQPLFTEADIANTQIIILDDHKNGPYWDLWKLVAHKPIIRIADVRAQDHHGDIIIPLAGASNTLWQGDWDPLPCGVSPTLHTFADRVLSFFGIPGRVTTPDVVIVTFIDRQEGRRLQDKEHLLTLAQERIPHIKINAVDFAALPFREQIQTVRDSDVLIGVHGAGLTHQMWMQPGSAVAEMLPPELNHKGFRNLAAELGHGYFSAHASPARRKRRHSSELAFSEEAIYDVSQKRDWHENDVSMEEDRWLNLVRATVSHVSNRGEHNFDVT